MTDAPNQVTVLFFATFKDLAGTRTTSIELPAGADVTVLKAVLAEIYPKMTEHLDYVLVAINKTYAGSDDLIPDGAEIALFPPVSGGDAPPTIFRVTNEDIDLNDLVASITLPSTGASCVFTGMVRGKTTRGGYQETAYLEYEAYVPMAEAKMQQVADEIREQWSSVEGIAIVQRIGRLAPGTPTVLIACSAGHRDTGVFEAARYGIDRLKQIVPIWKKEVGPDGESWVEGDYQPNAGE